MQLPPLVFSGTGMVNIDSAFYSPYVKIMSGAGTVTFDTTFITDTLEIQSTASANLGSGFGTDTVNTVSRKWRSSTFP
jgi:hypothetical protein